MGVVYEDFSSKTNREKILFMEDYFTKENIRNLSEKDIKRFFREVLDNEENAYLKIISIETLVFLTLINKIRKSSTVDMLLDIEENEDPFVLTTSLKYLTIFYENEEDILEKLESCRHNENPDVSSEAYYRLGLITFFNNNNNSKVDFYKTLEKSSDLFKYSKGQIENRTDAEYFYHVTSFLKSFLDENSEQLSSSFEKLTTVSFYRTAFYYNENLMSLEYKINKILFNLYRIYTSVSGHEGWLNFYDEFKKLSQYHFELISVSLSDNEHQRILISKFKDTVNSQILASLYLRSFRYYNIKIDNIINQYKSDRVLVDFLMYTKKLISNGAQDKKKEDDKIMRVCFQLKQIVPHVDPMELLEKLKAKKNVDNVEDVLSIALEYVENKQGHSVDYITGYEVGEEIFKNLQHSIMTKLPEYDKRKLNVFMRILEEIIRYLILTIRHKRTEEFKFLYTQENKGKGDRASERDLQDSLYKHFQYSSIAYGAEEEINNFADGGRVDIVFKIDNYTFPIELKKTKQKISKESVREKYLEQLHSYIYSYDQLGVFVLLDLNKKDKPVNDVRELVYLDHLKPLYELQDKYPDYIVVVIIPGNKPLPSDKSTYR